MKTVKIINGAYGQRLNGRTVLVRLGETCQVDDQEAARLVGLRAAEYVEKEPEPVLSVPPPSKAEESGGEPSSDANELEAMTREELFDLAAGMGLKVNKRMNEATLIQLITEAGAPAEEPGLPDLTPEGPVV